MSINTQFYTDNGLKIPIDIVIGTVPLREALPVIISQPVPQPTAPSVEGSPFDASASDLRKKVCSSVFVGLTVS